MISKTFYVTTPIYYPSDVLHIGHVYSTTLAWTLRNYKRLIGYNTKFLTGADEHGQKIVLSAQKANLNPQAYVDHMAQKFQDLWAKYKIDYDYFSRTSDIKHKTMVSDIFTSLIQSNDIYLDYYEGLYSISDEEFFTKTQAKLVNNVYVHPISGHPLIFIKESSFFLKITKYETWLKEYFKTNNEFIIPTKVLNEIKTNFLDEGLTDLSITRTNFDWGVILPSHNSHVIYVWLDALTNYLSALGYNTKKDQDYQMFWAKGDEIVHVIGKEISRFHIIYWPIILKALNLRQPNKIIAHGWLITPEGKMSKSKGNVIDPLILLEKYDCESIKYYLMSQIYTGHDGTFSSKLMEQVHNSDLANNFGNLLSRTSQLANLHFTKGLKPIKNLDKIIEQKIKNSIKLYQEHFDQFAISEGLKVAMELSRNLNAYIETTEPWNLTNDLKKLNLVLHTLCNGIYAVGIMLSVVMPDKIQQALLSLGLKTLDWNLITDFQKFNNKKIIKKEVLFNRIK